MLTSHPGRRPCLASRTESIPVALIPWQCAKCHSRDTRPRHQVRQTDKRRPGRRKLTCQSKGKPKKPLDDAKSS